jgi:hypothetical protein
LPPGWPASAEMKLSSTVRILPSGEIVPLAVPKVLPFIGGADDEPGETYWKVANGIRLTGMPGFNQQLSTTEMWQVSLLLAHAGKLPDPAKAVLEEPNKSGT